MRALRVALRVLAAEGPAAVRDRAVDRLEERRRRRAFPPARGDGAIAAPILNVLATPPAPRLGGLQIQLLRRLAVEAEMRACALLYPYRGGYRLERQHGGRREALRLPGPALPPAPALEDAAFEAAVLRAAGASRAATLHVEGAAGLPPATLLRLLQRGLRVILSLHDFALFCPRPMLLEQPAATFCGYCTDLPRCEACLGRDWSLAPGFQRAYRAAGAELLRSAAAVVHPSAFLRAKLLELVPGLDPAAHRVIAPAGGAAGTAAVSRPPAPVRHVAFVGTVRAQKGGRLFEEVVRQLGPGEAPGLRWSVFGGGEPDLLRRLRGLPGVAVRGYYRMGTLPHLLRRHRVDLALLLSITPEPYGLTLDECQEAGVPVIALDHGAIAERVRALGGGLLVPPEAGGPGVLAALREVLAGGRPPPGPALGDPGARIRHAALAHVQLYRELGGL
jgi:glycosyltransferase involved in cell wall biosynthesis